MSSLNCEVCGQLGDCSGTIPKCANCWEVERRLDEYMKSEAGRKFVLQRAAYVQGAKVLTLASALQRLFPNDASAPCVQIAWLLDKKSWYCSLCRFTEPFGQGRQVLWKGMNENFEVLMQKAADAICINLEGNNAA